MRTFFRFTRSFSFTPNDGLARSFFVIFGLVLFAISPPLFAHDFGTPGTSLWAGFWHPVSGIDHMLVIIGVSLWAASMQSKNAELPYFILPVVFLTGLLLGSIFAINHWTLPLLESAIAVSVVLMGMMLLLKRDLNFFMGLLLVSAFALLHGNAHFLVNHHSEAQNSVNTVSFMMGFMGTTALLQSAIYSLYKSGFLTRHFQTGLGIASCLVGSSLLVLNS